MPTVTFEDNSKGILVTAKEYVKGEKGDPGYTPIKGVDYFDGKDGKDGYTPVKGVDYFDGEPGPAGKDGYTPVKGVDYFDGKDGKDGEPGPAGPKGADGTMSFNDLTEEQKASLKGDDYILTEEDKTEIAQLALDMMVAAEGVEF